MNPAPDWFYDLAALAGAVVAAFVAYFSNATNKHKALVSLNVALLVLIAGLIVSTRYSYLPELKHQLAVVEQTTGPEGSLVREITVANEAIIERNRGVDDYLVGVRTKPEIRDSVRLVSSAARTVTAQESLFLSVRFDQMLRDLNRDAALLASGRYRVGYEDIASFSQTYINSARKSIVATSYVKPDKWWGGEQGRQYMEANRRILGQGISITRYFIFLTPAEFEQCRELVQLNVDAGVDTQVVCLSEVKGFAHAKDLILIDDVSGGELELSTDRDPLSALMSEQEHDLVEYRRKLANIHSHSTPARIRLAAK